MPIFHLHIRSGAELVPDEDGIDLPSIAEAEQEAVRGARSIMSEDVLAGRLRLDQSIELHDGRGQRVSTVRFRDVLSIEG